MNWRLYWSITTSNYEIKEFRSAISWLNAHQRECQRLEETEDSQIPLVVEDIFVFREMVQTPDNFTSSDSHDNQLRPKEKTTASLLCLVKSVANCVRLINWWNTRNNLSKREMAFIVLVQLPKRTFVHKRSYLLPVLEIASGSVNNGREDDPFTFTNFTMEGAPYDLMANIFCDLEDRRWPFEMMRNMWSWTWLTKLFYARAEICKFNPCLCITSSSAGKIFFLTVFLKTLVKIENIVSRTFSIQLVIILPF